MEVTQLTPESASYRGNRSVHSLERLLPSDWLWRHEFCGDEVEVYALDDALVLLPSREAQQGLAIGLRQLTAGWVPVDWWRMRRDPTSSHTSTRASPTKDHSGSPGSHHQRRSGEPNTQSTRRR